MRSTLFSIALFGAVLLIPVGMWYQWTYPTRAIEADLAADGITDVKLSYRIFSGKFLSRCNDKHATVRSYTGIKDGRYTQGVACHAPFWGAAHWAD